MLLRFFSSRTGAWMFVGFKWISDRRQTVEILLSQQGRLSEIVYLGVYLNGFFLIFECMLRRHRLWWWWSHPARFVATQFDLIWASLGSHANTSLKVKERVNPNMVFAPGIARFHFMSAYRWSVNLWALDTDVHEGFLWPGLSVAKWIRLIFCRERFRKVRAA